MDAFLLYRLSVGRGRRGEGECWQRTAGWFCAQHLIWVLYPSCKIYNLPVTMHQIHTVSEVFNNFDDILLRGFVIKSLKLVINKPSWQSCTAVLTQAWTWLESWAGSETFQKAAIFFFPCVGCISLGKENTVPNHLIIYFSLSVDQLFTKRHNQIQQTRVEHLLYDKNDTQGWRCNYEKDTAPAVRVNFYPPAVRVNLRG